MNRKFIATMCLCFCALAALASSSFYIKKDGKTSDGKSENEIETVTGGNIFEAENNATTAIVQPADKNDGVQDDDGDAEDENLFANVDNQVSNEEDTDETAGDRVSDVEEQASSNAGDTAFVSGSISEPEETTTAKVVKENPIKSDDANGLSEEANAAISKLEFGVDSELLWPVEGNILLEYSMDNTIYFPTLNEYKTNDALIIQSEEYSPVVASSKGVITEIGEDDRLGIYVKMAIGNGYEVKYGQVINPVVEVGQTVEMGDTIACVNEPTRYFEKEGYNLNFSVTKDGKAVDPMDYLIVNE